MISGEGFAYLACIVLCAAFEISGPNGHYQKIEHICPVEIDWLLQFCSVVSMLDVSFRTLRPR